MIDEGVRAFAYELADIRASTARAALIEDIFNATPRATSLYAHHSPPDFDAVLAFGEKLRRSRTLAPRTH
jgi:hypothetical protein